MRCVKINNIIAGFFTKVIIKMLKLCSNLLRGGFKKPNFSDSVRNNRTSATGISYFNENKKMDESEWPEKRKLRMIEKQPEYPGLIGKPPRMYKMIRLLRGPEAVHNELLYKGFGVKALLGGRLRFEHFEAIRNAVNRKINEKRMFAIWRVDAPWQPCSKKGIGKKMGGGKGGIHHYVTPVKANRIIVEMGGNVNVIEARKILAHVCEVLPFPSRFVSQADLEREKEVEEWIAKNNVNPYDMAYVIRNNMGGCQEWLSKYDYEWYGKYR